MCDILSFTALNYFWERPELLALRLRNPEAGFTEAHVSLPAFTCRGVWCVQLLSLLLVRERRHFGWGDHKASWTQRWTAQQLNIQCKVSLAPSQAFLAKKKAEEPKTVEAQDERMKVLSLRVMMMRWMVDIWSLNRPGSWTLQWYKPASAGRDLKMDRDEEETEYLRKRADHFLHSLHLKKSFINHCFRLFGLDITGHFCEFLNK